MGHLLNRLGPAVVVGAFVIWGGDIAEVWLAKVIDDERDPLLVRHSLVCLLHSHVDHFELPRST